jgi:hypothetical protein
VTEEILYQKVREGLKERPVLRIDIGGWGRPSAKTTETRRRAGTPCGCFRPALRHRVP